MGGTWVVGRTTPSSATAEGGAACAERRWGRVCGRRRACPASQPPLPHSAPTRATSAQQAAPPSAAPLCAANPAPTSHRSIEPASKPRRADRTAATARALHKHPSRSGQKLSPRAKSQSARPRIVQQPVSSRLRAMITMFVRPWRAALRFQRFEPSPQCRHGLTSCATAKIAVFGSWGFGARNWWNQCPKIHEPVRATANQCLTGSLPNSAIRETSISPASNP